MKFNLLVGISQINSRRGKSFGTGNVQAMRHLADLMSQLGFEGDLIDLPNGSRNPGMASPFSINSGFALNADELDLNAVDELGPELEIHGHLAQINAHYSQHFRDNRALSFQLKRSLMPWVLEHCRQAFEAKDGFAGAAYKDFAQQASYWLEDYVLFQAAVEAGLGESELLGLSVPKKREALVATQGTRMNYHRYVQFLCYQQRSSLLAHLKKLGIGLIANLPFGVDLLSADVLFHPEAFDLTRQIGCSPEPQNGYPEQAWGMPLYRERSAGLEHYLSAKMQWLSQISTGLFLDHMVGWCGQYALPRGAKTEPGKVLGAFLSEDPQERETNILWYLDLVLSKGLKILGEVAGDFERVEATKQGALKRIEQGADIALMRIPRWEHKENRVVPLKDYPKESLVAVETHDTSTLLQYLVNHKGRHEDFESTWNLLEFCRRVLGLPLHLSQLPLKTEQLSDDFCDEVVRRLSCGSQAEHFAMTLPSLLSWLSADYRNASKHNNINVMPGTSGEVGNEEGNWSFFSPPIELLEDPKLAQRVQSFSKRSYRPFEPFKEVGAGPNFSVIWAESSGREIIYLDDLDCFRVYRGQRLGLPGLMELSLANETDQLKEGLLFLNEVLDLARPGGYFFEDLNQTGALYRHPNAELREHGLYYRMEPGQIHHFLVWPVS
ncbi:MAG: 4-alpha-glucanotransferase [bacterium]|nr:4-alpha-glucanotransferase [bacterium]